MGAMINGRNVATCLTLARTVTIFSSVNYHHATRNSNYRYYCTNHSQLDLQQMERLSRTVLVT